MTAIYEPITDVAATAVPVSAPPAAPVERHDAMKR
jgi:hypothetical protein